MNEKIKLLFFGTPDFACPSLAALVREGYDIAAVVTAPDAPVGRGRTLTAPPVKLAAARHGIPVLQPPSLKDGTFFKTVRELSPDLCVVVAYGKIIPESYLTLPRLGFLNVHPSLLPKYRGPSPIQTAIMNGERETGVSIMLLDREVDHGPLLATASYAVPPEAYFPEISEALADLGAELLIKTIPPYAGGRLQPQEQDHERATFTKKFSWEDGKIDWERSAGELYDHIRALNPEPGAWTTYNEATLRILRASPVLDPAGDSDSPGLVVRHKGAIAAVTGRGLLILGLIQREGKKPLAPGDFANGNRDFIGTTLS